MVLNTELFGAKCGQAELWVSFPVLFPRLHVEEYFSLKGDFSKALK